LPIQGLNLKKRKNRRLLSSIKTKGRKSERLKMTVLLSISPKSIVMKKAKKKRRKRRILTWD
jgi:hypothetical protein